MRDTEVERQERDRQRDKKERNIEVESTGSAHQTNLKDGSPR